MTQKMTHYLILRSDAADLCGVEAFSRNLAEHLNGRARSVVLDFGIMALSKAFRTSDGIVLNFPIVAWKRRIVEPLLAVLLSKFHRKTVTVVLHEWDSLNWKRRLALWPVLRLADSILFSAPEIRDEWNEAHPSDRRNQPSALIPIPPNLLPVRFAGESSSAPQTRRTESIGPIRIGQFGSIYPKKNCAELLDIASKLRELGYDVSVLFIGSFIKAMDNVEQDFNDQVRERGLVGRVSVTGYLGTAEEVFAACHDVDVFCYKFTEGLTSRRGSVLAAALSGRRVVTNSPRAQASLAHHGLFQALIANGNIILCPVDASVDAMAVAVAHAAEHGLPQPMDFEAEIDRLWSTIVAELDQIQTPDARQA